MFREKWGIVKKEWAQSRRSGCSQGEVGYSPEGVGTTCLLSGCTWYQHLGERTWSRGRSLCVPLRDSGYIGLDLGVHRAPVTD